MLMTVSMHSNNVAAGLVACGTMQLSAAFRAPPLLWTPTIISWSINCDILLALALCTLHESDAQLVPAGLPFARPAAECISQHPPCQFLPAPAENPATL